LSVALFWPLVCQADFGKEICLASHAVMLSEFGCVGVLAGSALAFRNDVGSPSQKTLQTIAGVLLIAGLACFGVALSLVFGSPLP
jgi:hypothetical protein